MSNKSLFKKFVKGSPPKQELTPPRSKEEINKEYTQLAQQLGGRTIEAESIKRQTQQIFSRVDQLQAEMNARIKLDDAETEKKNAAIRAENKETKNESAQAVNN